MVGLIAPSTKLEVNHRLIATLQLFDIIILQSSYPNNTKPMVYMNLSGTHWNHGIIITSANFIITRNYYK